MPVVEDFNKLNQKESISVQDESNNLKKFRSKEILDKIGFGFSSQQFINILLLQTGASYFIIGLINVLRVIFGNLTFLFFEKAKNFQLGRKHIGFGGILLGFSFLLIGMAIFIKSLLLFTFAILISSVSVVVYGESKHLFRFSRDKSFIVEKITHYTLIITALSLFIAAFILDMFPISGENVPINLFNSVFTLKVYGYLIVFEVTAIAFILAGYILSNIKTEAKEIKNNEFKNNFSFFIKNKVLLLLIITNIVVSVVQITGYSYYGVYIFENFQNRFFGGFLNVAMVFLISVFSSLIGYTVIKFNSKVYRKFPILVFGTIMMAIMPFTYYFSQNLTFLTVGTIIGVIGSSAVGVTMGLLSIELISSDMRQSFFSLTNILSLPFFILIIPLLSYLAQIFGLKILFLILTVMMAVLIIILSVASITLKQELA